MSFLSNHCMDQMLQKASPPLYFDFCPRNRKATADTKSLRRLIETVVNKNKRPMGLDALLENQLGHLPKFQKLHIYSISTPRVKIELIFIL